MRLLLFFLLALGLCCAPAQAMNLIADGEISHTAVANGAWTSPATWDAGVPDEGATVRIPAGIEVVYSGVAADAIRAVRVDGVLRQYMHVPLAALSRVISRFKILGKLDIADRVRPQDGRVRVRIDNRALDLRLSTVPTQDAEKAVIRIAGAVQEQTLDQLEVPEQELMQLRQSESLGTFDYHYARIWNVDAHFNHGRRYHNIGLAF